MKLSIITTCKGRLHHLKQTLSRMIYQWGVDSDEYEIVLVDYGDPDNCYTWAYQEANKLKFSNLVCLKVLDNNKLWNPGRARNIGVQYASGNILFFVDADIKLGKTDVQKVIKTFQKEKCVIWRRDIFNGATGDTNGTFACRKKSFLKIKGFNEIGIGWCLEDIDIFKRFEIFHKSLILRDGDLEISVINHSSDLRKKFSGFKSIKENRTEGLKLFAQTRSNINPRGFGKGRVKVLRTGNI